MESSDNQHPSDEFSPRARKPYTITKQREKWSDEEHGRFVEALKLYGRSWRKIEEHIGTKTAVQIRSHAQKFFSKVVRDSNVCDGDSVNLIEIPPPRPKRKPLHPYPRNVITPSKARVLAVEIPLKLTALEQQNQSPKSLLSGVSSDSCCGTDSLVHTNSPCSSPLVKTVDDSETPIHDSDVLDGEDEHSSLDDQVPQEMITEDSKEPTTGKCIKLFGKILLVTETDGSSKAAAAAATTILFPLQAVPISICSFEVDACHPISYPWLRLCTNFHHEEHKEKISTDSKSRIAPVNLAKGFRPYKRCLTEQDSHEGIQENGIKVTV